MHTFGHFIVSVGAILLVTRDWRHAFGAAGIEAAVAMLYDYASTRRCRGAVQPPTLTSMPTPMPPPPPTPSDGLHEIPL